MWKASLHPRVLRTGSVLIAGGLLLFAGERVYSDAAPPKEPTKLLNPTELSKKLRNLESTAAWQGVRVHCGQFPSNPICEDEHVEAEVDVRGSKWLFFGVYDGHSGWNASAHLRQQLIPYVVRELNDPTQSVTEMAITRGFQKLDYDMVHRNIPAVLKSFDPELAGRALPLGNTGSCALLAAYDPKTRDLRLALTGDSRAVLGELQPSGEWTATALTLDQTGTNPDEVARIRSEHPGEPNCVQNGRILGFQPSRSFGDARTKWPPSVMEKLHDTYWGRRPSSLLKTPPYLTATPVVTNVKISDKKQSFMVLASDGLFELLTNDQIVKAVAEWVSSKPVKVVPTTPNLPGDGFRRGGRAPPFAFEDKNAGTHLIRNALGGADKDHLAILASIPTSASRSYRDDLTVTVVFFPPSSKL